MMGDRPQSSWRSWFTGERNNSAQQQQQQQQPPSPTFSEPWRQISWGEKAENLQYVQDYKPEKEGIKHIRILLYGPVGAGKSCFINSATKVLRSRMTITAAASAKTSEESFTMEYKTHRIKKERGNPTTYYPIVFSDLMGLEEGDGVQAEDIKLVMKGHVKDGYKFNPKSPLSNGDPWYNKEPSPDDRVHVLVCVLSANAAEVKTSVLEKMAEIRGAARDLGIPQVMIVTKIDEACGETEKDLRNVYKSKYVKKKMKEFSAAVGIPMDCIFPLKNYSEEIEIKDDIDSLILSALKCMVDVGDDFFDKM